ncbi:MAG TPA: serine/threonine-protein kinase [Longimicrobiales bacterium]|nr:serine/threonine-protein kinase [Longimicrobiales bacterium]
MSAERTRVEAVFEAALQLPAGGRDEFIERACSGNAAMARSVRSLLAAHALTGGLLDATTPAPQAEPLPDRFGPYRVLGVLGRGGMGVVYDAERDDGQFRRRVAIKILRAGSDPELKQRVLTERQILAALDHPGIARLLDGGVTADGRPFLVMEHVEGLPIDVYSERMRLDVRQRLVLFCEVARVVDYAHRNLVVHRDLKPSNIMVTPDGRVKLLDFGVAKLLHGWAAASGSPVTRDRSALTPEYASPEQLRGDVLTTTTDVYSLGVVLYELLAGQRPFQGYEGAAARHAEAICTAEPPRASGQAPAPRARVLRGDLDAILDMALRPEPGMRYGSAELLAQDIERYLALRRVRARQGSRAYAFGKLIRRHARTALVVATVALSLAGGTGVALWQARLARAAQAEAERAGAESARITDFLVELFEAGVPEASLSGAVTARDLVDRGLRRIDLLHDQPALQAPLLAALGRVLASLAEYADAEHLTQRALTLYEARHDEAGVGRTLAQLGTVRRLRGDYADARTVLLRALPIQQVALGADHPEVASTLGQLASVAIYLGEFDDAGVHAAEGLAIHQAALGDSHRLTLNSMRLLGQVQRLRGQHEEAEATLRNVVARRPAAIGSTSPELHEDRLQLAQLLALRGASDEAADIFRDVIARTGPATEDFAVRTAARNGLATLLVRSGDLAAAEQLLRLVHNERQALYGPEHPALARSATALGNVLLRGGRLAEAETAFREGARVYRASVGERHLGYANAMAQLAAIEAQRGRHATADSILAHAIALRVAGEGSTAHGLADLLRRRAEVAVAAGRFDFAESLLAEALANAAGRSYSPGVTQEIHDTYAALYRAWGRPGDADRHAALGRH